MSFIQDFEDILLNYFLIKSFQTDKKRRKRIFRLICLKLLIRWRIKCENHEAICHGYSKIFGASKKYDIVLK